MPYKHVDLKSLINAQRKIEGEIEKLRPFLENTTDQGHLEKLNLKKQQLESKLQQLPPLYERLCTLAVSQNQHWSELVEKNHKIAKEQIEKAMKDVDEVEAGKKQAALVLKGFDLYEKYIEVLAKQTATSSHELVDALLEYRENTWLECLTRLDANIGDKRRAERIKSINDNTESKAVDKRIREYKERLAVLRKRLEAAEKGSGKLIDLANEVQQLHERFETDTNNLLEQITKLGDSLREDTYRISRCKNHAAAEKAVPGYESSVILRADKIPPALKGIRGKLKTLEMEKDGMAKRVEGQKPLLPLIKAMEKLLQEVHDKAEECDKERASSIELVKTLSKKK